MNKKKSIFKVYVSFRIYENKKCKRYQSSFEIYYNFITKHQAINCCPYELATDIKLNSKTKWGDMIKVSKFNHS